MDCSPGGPCRPEPPLCPPCVGCGHGRVMWGAASILFWCAAVRRPQAWCARCSRTLVWARPAAATPAGAGGRGRSGARCAGPAASPPPLRRGPFWGRGASPRLRGGGGPLLWRPKLEGGSGGGGGDGGAAPPPPRPVGCRPAICCLWRAPPGYTRAVGVAGRPRASGAVRSAANGSVRGGGGGGREMGGTPPPWFAPPSSPGRPLIGPLRLRRPGRRPSAVGRQRAGRAGACLGRGAPAPRLQRPLRGGCGAAVSSVCHRPLFSLSWGGGGEWGGPSGPLAPPPDGRGGGGMAVPAPGASHRLGGRTLPPPPST